MFINHYLSSIVSLESLDDISRWAQPALDIVTEEMEEDPAHDNQHLLRVVRYALWFADDVDSYDKDILIPAALLHDLVNLPKDHPDRSTASLLSADKAISLLEDRIGFKSQEQMDGIHHAIRAHSYSAKIAPTTVEAKALQDADRLDALGYIGLARLFSVSGSLGRALCHPSDPVATYRTESQLDELKYAIDHFYTKLIHLPEQMQTDLGRKVANAKVGVMLDFIHNFGKEFNGEIVLRK